MGRTNFNAKSCLPGFIATENTCNQLTKLLKDVHRRQKLTTDFSRTFEIDYSGYDYYNSLKKLHLRRFPGGHILGA